MEVSLNQYAILSQQLFCAPSQFIWDYNLQSKINQKVKLFKFSI